MSSFKSLPPLKQWIITNKYFIKSSETKEKKSESTHYLLDGGIWKVPMNRYLEFIKLLSVDLQNGEKYYISENKTNVFRFICDLDFYEENEKIDIKSIVSKIQEVVKEYYGENYVIICGTESKNKIINSKEYTKYGFHLVWPKIWITKEIAKEIRIKFIEILNKTFGAREPDNSWNDVIDLAVYEDNGLRMIGCRKMGFCSHCNKKDENCTFCNGKGKIDEGRVYKPISVLGNTEEYLKNISHDYYLMLLDTCIINYAESEQTKLITPLPITIVSKQIKSVKTTDDLSIKIENFIRKVLKTNYSNVRIKKMEKQQNRYFIIPDINYCMNVNRNHTSSGVYFQIKETGICQRCFCMKNNCREYSSPEIPLTNVLQKLLFNTKDKKIINYNLKRNEINSTKLISLNNCKNVLSILENELI